MFLVGYGLLWSLTLEPEDVVFIFWEIRANSLNRKL